MLVNFVDLLAPPFADPRIERIKRVETTHDFRAAQIDGQRELHAPGTKYVGNAADLRNETVLENTRSCVHVVDGAAVDPDRCQQTSVLTGARQITADLSVAEENRRSAIAAFDATVEVVPLIHPADRRVRLLHFIDVSQTLAARDLA